MIRVLVVDDNAVVRRSIIETMPWGELGCAVAGEAEDGLSAWEALEGGGIDIVISDIRMPGLDGLELTDRIRRGGRSERMIIITGYDDFGVAQRAVKLGALDLILKPIDNRELAQSVGRAALAIEAERASARGHSRIVAENSELQSEMSRTRNELREVYLAEALSGAAAVLDLPAGKAKELGISFPRFAVALAGPLGEAGMAAARQAFQAASIPRGIGAVLCPMGSELAVLLHSKSRAAQAAVEAALADLCRDAARRLREGSGSGSVPGLRIGLGRVHRGHAELGAAAAEARSALESRFFRDEAEVLLSAELDRTDAMELDGLEQAVRGLRGPPAPTDEAAASLADRVCRLLKGAGFSDVARFRQLVAGLALRLQPGASDAASAGTGSLPLLLDELERLGSSSATLEWLRGRIGPRGPGERSRTMEARPSASGPAGPAVRRALDHIDLHYRESISLGDLAEIVKLTPAHLSRLIKKETGRNFIDLLNEARVEAAKRLLREGGFKVYEVGEAVGIENYAYFYQLFKRLTGKSPKDFQK